MTPVLRFGVLERYFIVYCIEVSLDFQGLKYAVLLK